MNKIEARTDLDDWDSEDEGELFHDADESRSDDEDEDDPIAELGELVDRAFMDSLGGAVNVNAGSVNAEALRGMRWSPVTTTFEDGSAQAFPGLTTLPGGPTARLVDIYDNPAALFFAFFPHSLWKTIALQSNLYERQTRAARAADVLASQRRRQTQNPEVVVEDLGAVRGRMRLVPAIEAWEIVRVVGLLVANVLCTHHTGIFQHWSSGAKGVIPTGVFGLAMPRNRFTHVLRFLHFSDNTTRSQVQDKAWKIRPVVTVLQERFRSLWDMTPKLSFDEGVLPSTSRMNTTRMYMPDKPHKWGTKMFMACDAATSYCFRCVFFLHFHYMLYHAA